jgi:hypothetical protein
VTGIPYPRFYRRPDRPPAFADYWIVRESPNGACRIVDVRPTDTKIVIVGNKAYKARDEAEKEMMVVCE